MPDVMSLRLLLLDLSLGICRLSPDSEIPSWANCGRFTSVTRTSTELSIVCLEDSIPDGIARQAGWRIFQVEGPLDFALTGVLASIAAPLARARVSILALSTLDTDYVMVRDRDVPAASAALRSAGHRVE